MTFITKKSQIVLYPLNWIVTLSHMTILWSFKQTNLQKVYCQFCLEAITHLDECMIWFIAEKFNSHNVPVDGEQVKKLILIYSLKWRLCQAGREGRKKKKSRNTVTQLKEDNKWRTSGFKLETRTVHLSFVPLIPGGKPPPKAAAIAAAFAI